VLHGAAVNALLWFASDDSGARLSEPDVH